MVFNLVMRVLYTVILNPFFFLIYSALQFNQHFMVDPCRAGLGVASTPDVAKNTILRPETDVAKCRQLCGLPRGKWKIIY